jgi:hypothetical protein
MTGYIQNTSNRRTGKDDPILAGRFGSPFDEELNCDVNSLILQLGTAILRCPLRMLSQIEKHGGNHKEK